MGLPSVMSVTSLIEVLNTMMSADELKQYIMSETEGSDDL